MKRLHIISLLFLSIAILTGCQRVVEATDNSLHTANFYCYNYTNSEFFAKLSPKDFRAKQKFRIQKSDYIPVKTDDVTLTDPDFSFEWIPGEFYLNITDTDNIFSVDNTVTLEFYTSKKDKISFENVVFFPGVPSAQDFNAYFYVIETFCLSKMSKSEYLDCINKITDEADKTVFERLYYTYSGENDNLYASISTTGIDNPDPAVNDNIYIKNYFRQVESIITKYDLKKGAPSFYFFSDEVSGELDFELDNPDDYKYLGQD